MKLAILTEEYLTLKQALGYRFETEGRILKAFHKTQGNRDLSQVTPAGVRAYLQGPGAVTAFSHRKLVALRGFYRFALERGYVTHSPLPASLPPPAQTFVPYVYSTAELQRLCAQLKEELAPQSALSASTFRTLLLVLYGAGLRLSEALRLTLADVDLPGRLLTIRESKFFKTRWVPVSRDLSGVLTQYAQHERLRQGGKPEPSAPFLVTRHGTAVSRQGAERAFRRLRQQAQVQRPAAARYQPRLHDLRHAFAVHRLVRWYRQGADVQRLLPQLATYLGHRNLAATQRYLTLTPELLQSASQRFAHYAGEGACHE